MDKPITLCDRCDIYMSCLLNYDGNACRRNRTVNPNHGDEIRSKSDEELATWLRINTNYVPNEGWLSWVKQEINK